MHCKACGKELAAKVNFCPVCGAAQEDEQQEMGTKSQVYADNVPVTLAEAMRKMESEEKYCGGGVQALICLSGYSHAQLLRLMKKYFNITPQKFIYNLRMNTAYKIIKNTDMDFTSVAETIGYSSVSHFCQTFKKHFGVTPSDLRKRL